MHIVRAKELTPDCSDPKVSALRLVTAERAKTMTAGVATFEPGARIVHHTHPCEETVIILEGRAAAYVKGQRHELEKYDTTIMDPDVPHYFANETDEPMTIAYFYPMANPARDPVEE